MKKENKNRIKEKGITLVALVITIIILIILATVTINVALGDNGLIKQAQLAKDLSSNTTESEFYGMNSLFDEYANMMSEDADINQCESGIIDNFKKQIASAITEAGVQTLETDSIETMANNIRKILQEKTKDATATAEDIVEGKTAWANGNKVTGTRKEDSITEHFKVYTQQVNGSVATLTNIVSISVKEDIEQYTELTADNFHVALSYGHCAIASSGNTYVRAVIDHYDADNGIIYVNTSGYGNISSYEIVLEVICIY